MKVSLILLFFVSCSFNVEPKSKLNVQIESKKDLEENKSMIGWDMMSLNYRLRPTLIRAEKFQDFSNFSSEAYVKKMIQYQNTEDKEYIDYMSSKDIQVVVLGNKKKFVVCTKSLKQQLVFCDDSYTPDLEFHSFETGIDLNIKIKEYI